MTSISNAYQTDGRLSYTAAFISLKYSGLYKEKTYQKAIIPELQSYYEQIKNQREHVVLHLLTSIISQPALRKILRNVNEFVLPGDLNHIALRKSFMFESIKRLQNEYGGLNIAFLGSGLDPLSHYTANLSPDNLVFELDSSPVLEIKKSAGFSFERMFCSHTLTDFFTTFSNNQNTAFPTIFVAEGFWDYSSESQIRKILGQISEKSHSDTFLFTTYFNFPRMSGYDAEIIRSSTASVGEKIKNALSLDEFHDLLQNRGFSIQQHLKPETLKERLREWDLGDELIDEFHLLQYGRM